MNSGLKIVAAEGSPSLHTHLFHENVHSIRHTVIREIQELIDLHQHKLNEYRVASFPMALGNGVEVLSLKLFNLAPNGDIGKYRLPPTQDGRMPEPEGQVFSLLRLRWDLISSPL